MHITIIHLVRKGAICLDSKENDTIRRAAEAVAIMSGFGKVLLKGACDYRREGGKVPNVVALQLDEMMYIAKHANEATGHSMQDLVDGLDPELVAMLNPPDPSPEGAALESLQSISLED